MTSIEPRGGPTSGLKAVLCDLDGTLADTERLNAAAYSTALRDFGYHVARERVAEAARGRRYDMFLPELAPGADADAMRRIAARKKEIYSTLVAACPLNSLLIAMLSRLRPHVKLALVTTASRSAVEAFMRRKDWTLSFDAVVTGDDVREGKPNPEAFVLAANMVGAAPVECLVLEDSESGLLAASRFGAQTLQIRGFPRWEE